MANMSESHLQKNPIGRGLPLHLVLGPWEVNFGVAETSNCTSCPWGPSGRAEVIAYFSLSSKPVVAQVAVEMEELWVTQ